jgi:hypothetical protein
VSSASALLDVVLVLVVFKGDVRLSYFPVQNGRTKSL